jgi:large subunit ribosomal protein L13
MKTLVAKSYMAKPADITHKWVHVDATDKVVGRLASDIAMRLMGKHLPTYTPHVDTGDYVIVTNAAKIYFSGKKWQNKQYEWYTGFTRLRTESAEKRLARKPELIIREAVRRMLPKNKLAFRMLAKLKIYPGAEHPHAVNKPVTIELGKK